MLIKVNTNGHISVLTFKTNFMQMRYVTVLLEKAIKYWIQKQNETHYIDWSPSWASSKVKIRLRFVNFEA